MAGSGYPLIEERPLDRARRRLLGSRREPSELPAQQPGTVLVFESEGRYQVLSDRRHLAGSESEVVGAVSVSVIDVRTRAIDVSVPIPSSRPGSDFTIVATFTCRVTEPATVARTGLTDVTPILRNHLVADRTLIKLGTTYRIDDINEVRELVTARIRAICEVRPPRIAGLSVALAGVDLRPPERLVEHSGNLQAEEWRHELESLKAVQETSEVTRMARMTPEEIEALGVSRGQINLGDAAQRSFEDREKKQKELLRLVEVLGERGHLDRVGIDAQHLVDQLSELLAGPGTSALSERPAADRGRRGLYASEGDRDDDLPEVVDEDELSS